MEVKENDKIYKIYINIYGLYPEKLKNYIIEYQSKKYELKSIVNKIIEYNNEIFEFEIKNVSKAFHFKIKLIENYINEILIDLNEDDNSKKYNIDLRIDNESMISPYIIIRKNDNNTYECKTYYNNLNISRIIILNTTLYFHIYLKDKKDKKEDKKDKIIKKLKKDLEKFKNSNKNKEYKKKKDNKIEETNNDFSLLAKKRKLKSVKKDNTNEYELKFLLDNTNTIESNNLLFCIHFWDFNNMTMTISDINQEINNNNNNNKIKTNEQLKELNLEISEKIKTLLILLEKVNLKDFRYQLLDILKNYEYNSDIFMNKKNNEIIENNEYNLYIEYFYLFIICNARNTIEKIIESFYSYYKNPTEEATKFLKKIIQCILEKYKQFNNYMEYIDNKNNNKYDNIIIIKKENLTLKEKINIYSILLTVLMSSPIYHDSTKIEFFDINSNNNNIYLSAYNLLYEIIDKLKTNSYFLKGFKQTFSKIYKDINKNNYHNNNNNDIFIIEMLSLEELKQKIKTFIPNRIIRYVNSKSFTNAYYDIISGDIIINEIIYKDRGNDYYINNNDNTIFDSISPFVKNQINLNNDDIKSTYDLYTFKAMLRINHEALGHKPIAQINNNNKKIPKKFIYNGNFKEINDAGNILEYFITDSNYNFNMLKNLDYNAKNLINKELFIGINFNEFWKEFNKLDKINKIQNIKKDNIEELYRFIYDIYVENIELKYEKFVRQKYYIIPQNKHKRKHFKI